jgi:hypothetical protein
MNIEYLKCLTENPKIWDLGYNHDPDWDVNKPMGIKEIDRLFRRNGGHNSYRLYYGSKRREPRHPYDKNRFKLRK